MAISATNEYGEGTPAGVPAAIPGSSTPAAPTLNAAKLVGYADVKLEWSGVSGAANYWIFQRELQGTFDRLPFPVEGTTFTAGYLFSGGGEKYEFYIVASNGTLWSPRSNIMRGAMWVPGQSPAPLANGGGPAGPAGVHSPPQVDPRLLRLIQSPRFAPAASPMLPGK
jgi:hypothetical protein